MSEAKTIAETLAKEWAKFKSDNDRSGANRDRETQEKLDRHSAAVGEAQKQLTAAIEKEAAERKELQAQVDELQKLTQRKGGPGADPKAEKLAKHREAFDAFMRRGDENGMDEFRAALQVGSNPDGGYMVPDSLDKSIEQIERDNQPMRGICNVMTVSNEGYEKLVNKGGASSGWVDELEARPESNTPQLAKLAPYFGEIYANPGASQKMLDDAVFDVEAWLASEVGIEFGEQENDAYTKGNGVKKPKGILGYTLAAAVDGTRNFGEIENLNSGSAGNLVADKMLDLIQKLKRGYRNGAVWMLSALGVGAARKLKDGQNNYLWQPSFVLGQPQNIAGYPVEENDDMPDPAAAANAAIFGNFRRGYTIVDVRGTRVLRDPYTNKPKVMFYTTKRVGGFVTNDRCFKVLTLT